MKKRPLILVGVVIAILVIVAVVFLMPRNTNQIPVPSETTDFPSVGSTTTSTNDGNFLNDGDVSEDPVNPGYYYLGYQTFGEQAVQDPPYLIEFIQETKYFNITLLHEPIGETRRTAEAYLTAKLMLTHEQMCSLNYTVGVPSSVNSTYASMNLGFSFCPGAVPLP